MVYTIKPRRDVYCFKWNFKISNVGYNECRKTKTKVFILANHKRRRQSNELIRTQSKYMLPAPSAGKIVGEQVPIGFRFASDWLGKEREIFWPITRRSNVKAKQSRKYFQ